MLVNGFCRFRMLRPYAPTRTASVNAHRVGGQGQALPLRADRGVLCRGNNMGAWNFGIGDIKMTLTNPIL